MITGWTWLPPEEPIHGGEFVFVQRLHEPGAKTVLGKTYPDTGVGQGRAVLADLARHPATAQHIAQKLARHFVADEPPPSLVAKLAKTFSDTDGNLKDIAKTLVTADELWTPQRTKLKSPAEWTIGVLRLMAAPQNIPVGRILGMQATLGEALWRPLSPNGYPDTEAAWIDGVPHRLDIANRVRRPACSEQCRSARRSRQRARSARFGRNARHHRARRKPPPGPGAPGHGAGIFAEMNMPHAPSRRDVMLASGTLFAWASMPKLALAEGRDPRFLTVILRGALDGLATVAPVGDTDWIALRGENALTLQSKTPALKLDDFFALNPAMPNLHRMFAAKEAIIVHACATPYRERSHFDGQDLLESGLPKPGVSDSGWLNRALSGLAPGGRVDPKGGKIFAVGPVTPLVVRGPAPVLSWSPQRAMPASADTVQRLLELYRHSDQKFASVLEDNARLTAIEQSGDMTQKPSGAGPAQVRAYFAEAAGTAAKFLAQPDGPRVGALALDGWDTHSNEGIAQGRLSQLLAALDDALAAIETNMGTAWRDTVVVLATEFGRTARINGTDGTDHGTATVALLVGGALKGGRVIADWPGLKTANLYENRDLKPTTDLRAVLKGVLKDHLRADERALGQNVFPGSDSARPMAGLVA